VRRRGRGTYVAPLTTLEEAAVVYEIRFALEGYLAERAAERIEPPTVGALDDLEREFEAVVERGGSVDVDVLVRIDTAFHWTIYEAADSDLTSILASYWGRLLRELSHRVYASREPAEFAAQHQRIANALRNRSPTEAKTAMIDHIRTGWDAVQASYAGEATPATPAGASHP